MWIVCVDPRMHSCGKAMFAFPQSGPEMVERREVAEARNACPWEWVLSWGRRWGAGGTGQLSPSCH